MANIIADIIITLLPDAFKKLRQGGLFLASGVIKERLCDVEKRLGNMVLLSLMLKTVLVGPQSP